MNVGAGSGRERRLIENSNNSYMEYLSLNDELILIGILSF
jgi:hypothetical protein